ncbi:hsp90 co-chaperone Cdc37-like [Limulus polyphemus]|uniref:Hsp90 chaperone protein kinase-targeting subunit n=1 Tax=Limulus polyphemus TaxID=6850 RepID=A0ABM1BMH2_LIMPO|nr:hsp90 co-chaperone Cdc37-like [Limulus polyphemus]
MVDYSKWKAIEVSDDEDETHPNIDTASLFRWRHQARMERMAELEKEKAAYEAKKQESQRKLSEAKKKLLESQKEDAMNLEELKKVVSDLEEMDKKIKKEGEELSKKERLMPWNVDTISKDGFTKTKRYVKENESLLKKYGMLQKYDDSKRFLQEHPHLACEDTANYLVIWCINLEVEEKHQLMEHVAHQCICMQYLLELAKQLDVDPRACISSFFSRIQMADREYKDSFDDELRAFKERIKKRAQKQIEDAVKEVEEEERQKRLGPGGLDPVEVLESLPESLRKCFETQDIPMLQQVITQIPEEEARYHMKRCIDSGLWIPDAKAAEESKDASDVKPS